MLFAQVTLGVRGGICNKSRLRKRETCDGREEGGDESEEGYGPSLCANL